MVAKLKEAGQPQYKITQVTVHARESSLDDYDEITESKKKKLFYIASGYVAPKLSSVTAQTSKSTASCSTNTSLPPATLPEFMVKENIPTNLPGMMLFTCQISL